MDLEVERRLHEVERVVRVVRVNAECDDGDGYGECMDIIHEDLHEAVEELERAVTRACASRRISEGVA